MHDHLARLRIVMLEDRESDRVMIERTLNNGHLAFDSVCVDTRDEFLEALDTFKPDIILSDHALPQFNSLEAFKLTRERGLIIPFLLVTGAVSEEFAVDCLKQGIDDYILKNNLSRLPSAITNALEKYHSEAMRRQAERSVQQQNEELLRINNQLDRFVYSVSHNLRGPVSTIKGLINLAMYEIGQPGFSPEYYFHIIDRRVDLLDHTIRLILNHSQNARLEVNLAPVNLRSIITSTLYRLTYLSTFQSLEFINTVPTDFVVITDEIRLSVMLECLLSNAIKYMDEKKSKWWVGIRAEKKDDEFSISIQDNGIGIREDIKTRIFDMFFRGTSLSDGAGLGLYIARECAEKLGGRLTIRSEEGEGTTVKLLLPVYVV